MVETDEGERVVADGTVPCPGCGLVVEPAGGPTHPYMGASPGCWARFGELLAASLAVPGQVVVDTYAAQHPGVPERRAIQSVAVHLVSLCAVLERGWAPGPDLLRRALRRPAGWQWLELEPPMGTITVADVLAGGDPGERARRVDCWTEDVWAAWSPHHGPVRRWLDEVVGLH